MPLSIQEFAVRVREMRRLQVEYFKRRDPGILEQSKAAEKFIDRACSEIIDPPLMFGGDE